MKQLCEEYWADTTEVQPMEFGILTKRERLSQKMTKNFLTKIWHPLMLKILRTQRMGISST